MSGQMLTVTTDQIYAKQRLDERWQHKWDNGRYGRWTWSLIPNISLWISRQHGEVDYFLTQALAGHGCFRKYLFDRARADSPVCTYCKDVDDAQHTLFICERWKESRERYVNKTGHAFNALNMMSDLLESETLWNHAYSTIRCIIETKERESRRTT